MNKFFFLLTLAVFVSCGDSTTKEAEKPAAKPTKEVQVNLSKEVSKTEAETMMSLLHELNICSETDTEECSTCDVGERFRLFQLGTKPITEAFALQIKAHVHLKGEPGPANFARLQIYERENGKLVLVNEMLRAHLVSILDNGKALNDFKIAIYSEFEQMDYFCQFTYDKAKYRFKDLLYLHFDGDPEDKIFRIPADKKAKYNEEVFSDFSEKGWIY